MKILLPSNLNTRVFIPLTIGLFLLVAGFAVVGLQTVNETIETLQQERLVLAEVSAERVDELLGNMLDLFRFMVTDSNFDPAVCSEANQTYLKKIYDNFDGFANHVVITDERGFITGSYPLREDWTGMDLSNEPTIQYILGGADSLITNLDLTRTGVPVAWMKLRLTDEEGETTGVIFASLNLNDPRITNLMLPIGLGETGFAELIDNEGDVMASGQADRILQNIDCEGMLTTHVTDHSDYVGEYPNCIVIDRVDLIAFAPLNNTSWGIVIRQDKTEALAYSSLLGRRFLIVGLIAAVSSALIMVVVEKRLVVPMKKLSLACEDISKGDLNRPLPFTGYREIDQCIRCFEILRVRLKASVEAIEKMNIDLEQKVTLRTRELEEAEQTVTQLLHKIVAAQEEERQRVARELHDETSQSLTALAVMLNTVILAPAATPAEVKDKLGPIKDAATAILDEINRIILDLRPGILDDLGLVQAIDWYAETRLEEVGIFANVWATGKEKRLPPEVEVMVFRIAQEAINNIIKHAKANQANIHLDYKKDNVVLTVEDDGKGIDPEVLNEQGKNRVHFGLLGMKERAALINGDLQVITKPGENVRIILTIPY